MDLESIYQNVITGQAPAVQEKVRSAIEAGISPETILKQGLIKAMDEVGRLFEAGEYYVPEMLVAARAMQAGLQVLKPYLADQEVHSAGKIAIGTVKGDLHDIGKNLVGMMLEGAGFEVVDLGVDVTAESFARAVESGVQVIGMSALLTTTMGNMQRTIDHLVEKGLRERIKVIVGGAPVTDEYARQIGADAYAPDVSSAARAVRQLVQ